jgi:hypothetical protein
VSELTPQDNWDATASSECLLNKEENGWLFVLKSGCEGYHNAQVDDYRHLKRSDFKNTEGLSLEAEIRWSHETPLGTSGIGFWNDPFMMTGWRWPSLPVVAWFLITGKDSEMKVGEAEGSGLKAQVIDADHLGFLWRLPIFLLAPLIGRFIWKRSFLNTFSKGIRLSERRLEEKAGSWRHLSLNWKKSGLELSLDGKKVLSHPQPLRGPLGLVIWQDNQWLKFDPTKGIRWGTSSPVESQSMAIRNLVLKKL